METKITTATESKVRKNVAGSQANGENKFDTEREACVKFIEITDKYYHLSKYLGEFQEEITAY